METRVITHRGLDPAIPGYYPESSVEAFRDQLNRGYGLEFDIQFASDDTMIAVHDPTLKRITGGKDERKIRDVASPEILAMEFSGCHLTTVPQVLSMIANTQAVGAISALHLKHLWQEPRFVVMLLDEIRKSGIRPDQFIIFDVKPEMARYIKGKVPGLELASSVSHPHDIERYNSVVGGTLISIADIIAHKDLFSWAWLDEWDLADKDGGNKVLYTKEVFDRLRANGIRIALVTPEMHAKSPGLLGGEAHPDGKDHDTLVRRLREIVALRPDAICTDWPDLVKNMKSL